MCVDIEVFLLGFIAGTMLSAGIGAAPSLGFEVTVGLKLLGLDFMMVYFCLVSANSC